MSPLVPMFIQNSINVLNDLMDKDQKNTENDIEKKYETEALVKEALRSETEALENEVLRRDTEALENKIIRRKTQELLQTTTEKVLIAPPQLTWIKVQKLSPQIAKNLARFGTPYLGGPRKSRKSSFHNKGYTKKSQMKHLGWIQ